MTNNIYHNSSLNTINFDSYETFKIWLSNAHHMDAVRTRQSPSQIDHRMRPNFSVRASIEWCLLYSEVSESILHRKLRLRHDNAFMGRL